MFENILGTPKEEGMQCYYRDDGGFIYRKMEILDGFLVERDGKGEVTKAWLMFYKLLKTFKGFKNIEVGKVTLSYGRDILLDPFKQLTDTEKPKKGMDLKKEFVKNIAEAKCYKHERAPSESLILSKAQIFMGVVMVILALVIGLKAVL